jgi:hypothetical protein
MHLWCAPRCCLSIRPGQISDKSFGPAATHCARIADGLGLAFCKLSLVAAADGDCYCFGLDRTPQLYQCAIETQIEVVRALVRALATVTEPS